MSVRKAEIKDAGSIHRLLKQIMELHKSLYPDIFTGESKYREEDIRELIEQSDYHIYVYEDDEKVVRAYLIGWEEDYGFFIDDLCVDEEYRGKGVGDSLMETVTHYPEIRLNVWAENGGAIHFYHKKGFKLLKYVMRKT